MSASPFRRLALLLLDGFIAVAALWVAMELRFEGNIPAEYAPKMPLLLTVIGLSRIAASLLFRLQRWSFGHSSLPDAMRVVLAAIVGTWVFLSALFFFRIGQMPIGKFGPPRSVVVLEFFLSMSAMGLIRFAPRVAGLQKAAHYRARKGFRLRPTIVVGGGAEAETVVRDLQRSQEHDLRVVGFVDEDPSKWGMILCGVTVLGGIEKLSELVKRHEVELIAIAVPSVPANRIREIHQLCKELDVEIQLLPVSFARLGAGDGMGSDEILAQGDHRRGENGASHFNGPGGPVGDRVLLVVGALASIARAICLQALRGRPKHLILVDNNKHRLNRLRRELRSKFPKASISIRVADICSEGEVNAAFESCLPQDVFHLASPAAWPELKGVAAVKNLVLATRVAAKASETFGAERFIYLSTANQANPKNVLAASKPVNENLLRSLARHSPTKFCAIRFSNARAPAANGVPASATDDELAPMGMEPADTAKLILRAAYGDFGELSVLDIWTRSLVDLEGDETGR